MSFLMDKRIISSKKAKEIRDELSVQVRCLILIIIMIGQYCVLLIVLLMTATKADKLSDPEDARAWKFRVLKLIADYARLWLVLLSDALFEVKQAAFQ